MVDGAAIPPTAGWDVYRGTVSSSLGRALSLIDDEPASPSLGSMDRTWWCWKFTDFSAPRFQEGALFLAWLATSERAPSHPRSREHAARLAGSAVAFWTRLQHADGSFDEAYPFERSLAATAFTTFYLGSAIERLRHLLPRTILGPALATVEKAATWLDRNGEHHGILSNHLAAAAAAAQVAGDLLGTDRFAATRDRYIGIIRREQDPAEGWMREYGGADPGYQSHGMFYLADVWRRARNAELHDSLRRASDFIAWFAHPDGSMGGEYASRGTRFAYPAAFEILAATIPSAKSVACHLRMALRAGRAIGPRQVDAWNFFPLLNNHVFALDHAAELGKLLPLPWQSEGATKLFPRSGLIIAHRGGRLLACGLTLGGAVKLWSAADRTLLYQDCGYADAAGGRVSVSQAPSQWERLDAEHVAFRIAATFAGVPSTRFDPWRFMAFRSFTLTVGRIPGVARWLKQLLVRTLIHRRKQSSATLQRVVSFDDAGVLRIEDRIEGVTGMLSSVERQVPFHMGSARYVDDVDWACARVTCDPPQTDATSGTATRATVIPAG